MDILTDEQIKKWKRQGCEHNSAGSDGEPLVLKGDCPLCWEELYRDLTLSQCKGVSEEEIADILSEWRLDIYRAEAVKTYFSSSPIEIARKIILACRKPEEQVRKETKQEIANHIATINDNLELTEYGSKHFRIMVLGYVKELLNHATV
jgi:hypothetical protein